MLVQNINYSLTHGSSVDGTAARRQMQRRYSCETGQVMKCNVDTNTSAVQLHSLEDKVKN